MYSYETCVDYGLTGVMSRSVGIKRDLRLDKLETYANYYYLNFRSYTGFHGDCYDRFLIRMNEMCESINIINQVILKLTKFNKVSFKSQKTLHPNTKVQSFHTTLSPHVPAVYLTNNLFNSSRLRGAYNSMESLIEHFKF